MAYVTGTAASFANLLTALRNACTANGWTLSGDVLHKGDCYVETKVAAIRSGAPATGHLIVRAGNGIDGANALTDPAPRSMGMGLLNAVSGGANYPDWDWPVTYHVHIHGDEVHMFANYDAGQRWQFVAFGRSPAPGCVGTGNWCTATMVDAGSYSQARINSYSIQPEGAHTDSSIGGGYFWGVRIKKASAIHGAHDATTGLARWSNPDAHFSSSLVDGQCSAAPTQSPLLSYLPNAWNSETILLPIQIVNLRPESKVSLIGELQHARVTRNDFIVPGGVITLGPDKWKVYPFYKKDTTQRDGVGSSGTDHSGTMAVAIRYDGP